LPTRRKVEEEREGRGRYGGNPQQAVLFDQLRVVRLLVGRAAGGALLIGRHPLIVTATAVGLFPVAARVRAGLLLPVGTRAPRGPRRNVSSRKELADAHARRHEQRPTRQEENQRSEQAETHGTGTPVRPNTPPSGYIRHPNVSTRHNQTAWTDRPEPLEEPPQTARLSAGVRQRRLQLGAEGAGRAAGFGRLLGLGLGPRSPVGSQGRIRAGRSDPVDLVADGGVGVEAGADGRTLVLLSGRSA
jgi:hypothetical protein